MTDTRPAILFDVDGTLVDTNYLHTLAWWRALQKAGHDIAMSRIHPLIGMGSDHLLTELLGEEPEGLSDAHSTEYEPLKEELHAFPRAADILVEVDRRGGRVVLATSSKKDDVPALCDEIGASDAVDAVVDGSDVGATKPSPDIFAVALEKLGLDAERTIVVGDTVWDVEAASKLDLPVICVLTGGQPRHDLEAKGAAAVYEDVADLFSQLDQSPLGKLLAGR
ncbi:MAG: HAD family hydrolase [Acidimicrobiales bacterium]